MLSQLEIENNLRWENSEMCSKCGGYCCQQTACPCSPDDFNNNVVQMYDALKSGNYSIDFLRDTSSSFISSGNSMTLDIYKILATPGEALFIRPKNKNCPTVDIIHPIELGPTPCIFWTSEHGCKFKYEDRPKFGRATVPIAPGYCTCAFHDEEIADEWKTYTFELFKLAKEFFPKDWKPYKVIGFVL